MAKFVELQEAAEMLGITPEELVDMRSRGEISGYRDGSTWKFKPQELDRVKSQLGDAGSSSPFGLDDDDDLIDVADANLDLGDVAGDDDLDEALSLDIDLNDDADVIEDSEGDDSDSILVSEEELGQSDENTASTIIGEPDELPQENAKKGGDSDALAGESDLELSLESSDVAAASDVLGDLDDLDSGPSASDTANLGAGAGASDDELKLQSDSGELNLNLDDLSEGGSRIELADDDADASSSGFGSAIDLGLDDDELVLGSGTGSDVTLGTGDSGINLNNPSDSGLSLEEPLDGNSGSGVESLELGEDDMLDLDESLASGASPSDDDFMLEPVEDGLDDESDSGSQVIALDSEEFDDSAVGMLSEDDGLMEAETAEFIPDDDSGFDDAGGLETAGMAAGPAAMAAPAVAGEEQEANYSVLNVISLFTIVLLLGFTGILMLDLINNIWSWDEPYGFSSTIMEAILGMMPG